MKLSLYSGNLSTYYKSITLMEGKNSCTSLIMNGLYVLFEFPNMPVFLSQFSSASASFQLLLFQVFLSYLDPHTLASVSVGEL